ncbi:unnamed protein product, partial [Urochloa humidicola]
PSKPYPHRKEVLNLSTPDAARGAAAAAGRSRPSSGCDGRPPGARATGGLQLARVRDTLARAASRDAARPPPGTRASPFLRLRRAASRVAARPFLSAVRDARDAARPFLRSLRRQVIPPQVLLPPRSAKRK